ADVVGASIEREALGVAAPIEKLCLRRGHTVETPGRSKSRGDANAVAAERVVAEDLAVRIGAALFRIMIDEDGALDRCEPEESRCRYFRHQWPARMRRGHFGSRKVSVKT